MGLFKNMEENYKRTLVKIGYSEQAASEEARKNTAVAKVLLMITAIIFVGVFVYIVSSHSSSSSSYSSYTSGGCPYTYSDGSRCGREVGKGDTYCSYHTVKKYAHDKKSEDHNNFD